MCVRGFFSRAKKQTSRIDGKRTITVISALCVCTAHGMKSLCACVSRCMLDCVGYLQRSTGMSDSGRTAKLEGGGVDLYHTHSS